MWTRIDPRRTPLRRWKTRSGVSWRELSRRTDVSYRTILRVAAGKPCSAKIAKRLSRATRIRLEDLI